MLRSAIAKIREHIAATLDDATSDSQYCLEQVDRELAALIDQHEADQTAHMSLWLVQPDPWGSGDGVDGFVIRAESKQAAEAMATDYHECGHGVWLAKPLTPEGDAKIVFGAERSCWELDP